MNHEYEFEKPNGTPMVYVRPVPVAELPDELRAQSGDLKLVYAVHDAEGQRLALVESRAMAFVLARQNEMSPVSVH